MPTLCLKCHAEVESNECDYCGSETEWFPDLYEIKITWSCDCCGSKLIKRYDCGNPDFPELLENNNELYCSSCQGIWKHTAEVSSSKIKVDLSTYLGKIFEEELQAGYRKRHTKKKHERDY